MEKALEILILCLFMTAVGLWLAAMLEMIKKDEEVGENRGKKGKYN